MVYGSVNYKGYTREEALEDFMTCNWAWFFEETPY